MSGFTGTSGGAVTVPFVNPVVVNQPLALTTATGSGAGPHLALATTGHVPGSVGTTSSCLKGAILHAIGAA